MHFLEDCTYGEVKDRHPLMHTAIQAASNLRTFELALNAVKQWQPATQPGSVLASEVDTILATNGPQTYERNDAHQTQTLAINPQSKDAQAAMADLFPEQLSVRVSDSP